MAFVIQHLSLMAATVVQMCPTIHPLFFQLNKCAS